MNIRIYESSLSYWPTCRYKGLMLLRARLLVSKARRLLRRSGPFEVRPSWMALKYRYIWKPKGSVGDGTGSSDFPPGLPDGFLVPVTRVLHVEDESGTTIQRRAPTPWLFRVKWSTQVGFLAAERVSTF